MTVSALEKLSSTECGMLLGLVDSMAMQKLNIGTPYVVGTQVFMDVEADVVGGDASYFAGSEILTLDCTTGDGRESDVVPGNYRARVELPQGTFTDPQFCFVHATWSDTESKVVLVASEQIPVETSYMSVCYSGLQTYVESDGNAILWQRVTDVTTDGFRGALSHAREKLRRALNNNQIHGCEGHLEFTTNGASRDNIAIKVNGGSLYQLHLQQFSAFDSSTAGFLVVNQAEGCAIPNFSVIQDLGSITETGDGEALVDGDMIMVDLYAIMNSSGLDTIAVRIGRDVWRTDSEIQHAAKAYSAKRLPLIIDQVAAVIGRAVLRYNTADGGTWTNALHSLTTTSYWKRVNQTTIKTPNYPNYYPNSQNLNVGDTTITGASMTRTHFRDFNTEQNYDECGLRAGSSTTDSRMYHGSLGAFLSGTVSGNRVVNHFGSDGSVGRKGYYADYVEGWVTETIGSVSGDILDMR